MSRRSRQRLEKVERRNDSARDSRRRAQRQFRWLLGGLGATILIGSLILFGGYWWFRRYLSSDQLRSEVERQLGQQLEARVEISPQEWHGNEVHIDKARVRGSGHLEAVDLSGFVASFDFSKLWSRLIDITDLSINQLQVVVDRRTPVNNPPTQPSLPEVFEEESPPPAGSSFAPKATRLGKITIARGGLRIRSDFGDYHLSDTEARIEPFSGNLPGQRISLNGGKLELPLGPFPEMELVTASLRHDEQSTYLSSGNLRFGKRGHLDLSGEWQKDQGSWKITATGDTIEIDELVSPKWRDSLEGLVEFSADGRSKPSQGTVWSGDVEISKGAIRKLSLLDTLAAYTRKPEFQAPALEEATFHYRIQNGITQLSEINLYSRNLARIEGNLGISDDEISGTLMVGIPAGTLSFIPGAETKVFRADNNGGKYGWLWAPVRIKGRDGEWTEDLTRRIIDAAGDRLFEMVPETGEKVLKFTRTAASDIIQDPIEGGLNAVEEGARLIDETLNEMGGGLLPRLPLPRRPSPAEEKVENEQD